MHVRESIPQCHVARLATMTKQSRCENSREVSCICTCVFSLPCYMQVAETRGMWTGRDLTAANMTIGWGTDCCGHGYGEERGARTLRPRRKHARQQSLFAHTTQCVGILDQTVAAAESLGHGREIQGTHSTFFAVTCGRYRQFVKRNIVQSSASPNGWP
jgi:hypothetical protein